MRHALFSSHASVNTPHKRSINGQQQRATGAPRALSHIWHRI